MATVLRPILLRNDAPLRLYLLLTEHVVHNLEIHARDVSGAVFEY
jgi:hypothetical protein